MAQQVKAVALQGLNSNSETYIKIGGENQSCNDCSVLLGYAMACTPSHTHVHTSTNNKTLFKV